MATCRPRFETTHQGEGVSRPLCLSLPLPGCLSGSVGRLRGGDRNCTWVNVERNEDQKRQRVERKRVASQVDSNGPPKPNGRMKREKTNEPKGGHSRSNGSIPGRQVDPPLERGHPPVHGAHGHARHVQTGSDVSQVPRSSAMPNVDRKKHWPPPWSSTHTLCTHGMCPKHRKVVKWDETAQRTSAMGKHHMEMVEDLKHVCNPQVHGRSTVPPVDC